MTPRASTAPGRPPDRVNGQTVTVISVHDASGYHNVVKMPTGDVPVDGTFPAADGNWSSNASYPNNGGTYRFQDNDHVVADERRGANGDLGA